MRLKKQFTGSVVVASIMFTALALHPAAHAAAVNVDAQDLAQSAIDNAASGRIDMQIRELHDQLRITPIQEHLWRDVAELMRVTAKKARMTLSEQEDDDTSAPEAALDERSANRDLQRIRHDSMRLLSDPFNRLYEEMSAEQKKNADELFARSRETVEASGDGTQ